MQRLLILFFLQTASLMAAGRGTWSLSATKLQPCAPGQVCHSKSTSPDGVFVTLSKNPEETADDGRLIFVSKRMGTFALAIDPKWNVWAGIDVFWSPNANFLAATGSLNAYTESTRVYEVTPTGIVPVDIFHEATADMLRSFSPCKTANIDRENCVREKPDLFFNFAAIAWSGPSSLVVMVEVPCSSSYGDVMCQVLGYEVDTRTGRILHRMDARQFKARWQQSMAWNLRVPEQARFSTH